MNIKVLNHASIKMTGQKTIYFDPYQLMEEYHDADIIFITHDHYDHYEESSIKNAMTDKTILVVPTSLEEQARNLSTNLILVEPNKTYTIDDILVEVIPSYNTNKDFHPKEKNYVGYNITIDDTKYYIMGDTDRTSEADSVQTDICLVPIGGTYTMNVDEAVAYINDLKPKKVIPIHYGTVAGDKSFGNTFKEKINNEIKVEVQIN